MTIWFSRKFNGVKKYCSKSVGLRFVPRHWKMIKCFTNGALKGRKEDTCYDFHIYFMGIFFNYTNYDYNR